MMAPRLNSLIRTALVLLLAFSMANGTAMFSAMGHAGGKLAELACQTAYGESIDQIASKGIPTLAKGEVGKKAAKNQSTPQKTSDVRCCIAQCNAPATLPSALLPALSSTVLGQFASSSVELRPTGNDPLHRPPRSPSELA